MTENEKQKLMAQYDALTKNVTRTSQHYWEFDSRYDDGSEMEEYRKRYEQARAEIREFVANLVDKL